MKKRYTISSLCFDKAGICISHGNNSYTKTHPLQKYFAEKVGQPEKQYLHAEIQALIHAKEQQVYEISIYHYDRFGRPLDGKPCPICIEAMKAFGVKKVSYTTKNGWIYGKTPEEMASTSTN